MVQTTSTDAAQDGCAPPGQFGPLAVIESASCAYEVHGASGLLGKVAYRRGFSRWAVFDGHGKLVSGRHRDLDDALSALLYRVTRVMAENLTSGHFATRLP